MEYNNLEVILFATKKLGSNNSFFFFSQYLLKVLSK